MSHQHLNLPLFKGHTLEQMPDKLHHIVRTIREWGRSLDTWANKHDATPFKPTLTGTVDNPSLGADGTAEGWYSEHGDLILFQFVFRFSGAGIKQGSGQYRIPLPRKARAIIGSSHIPRGHATILDASTPGNRRDYLTYVASTFIYLRDPSWGAFAAPSIHTNATIGLTFATGDYLMGQVIYHHQKPRTLIELD